MNQSSNVGIMARKGGFFLIVSAIVGLAGAACSTAAEPSTAPALRLEGRYALEPKNGSSPRYAALWFGKDGRYEGKRASCAANCTESGTYSYTLGELSLVATGGAALTLRIRAEDAVASALRTSTLEPRQEGAPSDSADAEPDDPCADSTSTKSVTPRASGDDGGLLAGEATCLLPGILKGFAAEGDDPKEKALAKLVGKKPPSEIPDSQSGDPALAPPDKIAGGCIWPQTYKCFQKCDLYCFGDSNCSNIPIATCRAIDACHVEKLCFTDCYCSF